MISREQATRIAEGVIRENDLGTGIRRTLLLREIQFQTPRVFDVDLSNCWVVFAERGQRYMIASSRIVAIDRDTGRVVYKGSADDEG